MVVGGGESRKSRTLISLIIAIMRQVKMGQMNDLHNELIHAISIRSFKKYEMQKHFAFTKRILKIFFLPSKLFLYTQQKLIKIPPRLNSYGNDNSKLL